MKKILIITIISLLIILPILWYLISPLFIDQIVNEEVPIITETIDSEIQDMILFQGTFQDADSFHKVKGTVKVLSNGNINYLRFEDFKSTNGPDLKVYLAKDIEAKEYISLGDLKGNIGNQNYELNDINIKEYSKVLIWCERFSVLFGYSDLS